jgi:hypothetical protein
VHREVILAGDGMRQEEVAGMEKKANETIVTH